MRGPGAAHWHGPGRPTPDDRHVVTTDPRVVTTSGDPRRGPVSGAPARPEGVATAEPAFGRRLAAEAFGAFALVFVAAGADTMARVSDGAVSAAARAVAPGLVVLALVYALGDVSGAHFNPAVSLAFAIKGLFPAGWLPAYWSAQGAGAVAAAALLRLLFGAPAAAGVFSPNVPAASALVLETILTLLLVAVVIGTADRARVVGPNAAVAVGTTISCAA